MRISGNPLLNYVEVPKELKDLNLQYQSIFKGVIRGAFEILQLKATVSIVFENLNPKEKNETIFFIELSKLLQSKND
jgi:hypothetical protein